MITKDIKGNCPCTEHLKMEAAHGMENYVPLLFTDYQNHEVL